MKTVHITTGDPDGIGLEVSLKALNELGPIKNIQFVLWRSVKAKKEMFSLTDTAFNRVSINETNKSVLKNHLEKRENNLLDMICSPAPTQWVMNAAKYCMQNKKKEVLVTGPLSKVQMQKEGFKEKGHTGLLKKISGAEDVFMAFLGEFFNVVLLTGHVPLKKIKWSKQSLSKCIQLCLNLEKFLPASSYVQNKKLAVVGFNPHAGEEGLLGTEEVSLKKELKKWKNTVEGPLVPDIAFFKKNWELFSIYICLYHDQALIPFKMIHERKSFQLNLGLPFIRTSVSHGTAKDIFGKNKADAQSMKQALLWAIHSIQKS